MSISMASQRDGRDGLLGEVNSCGKTEKPTPQQRWDVKQSRSFLQHQAASVPALSGAG